MRGAASILIPVGAILLGTTFSASLLVWFAGPPRWEWSRWQFPLLFCGCIHLVIVGSLALLGERLLEDIVKGMGLFVAAWVAVPSQIAFLLGIVASAVVLGIGANQWVRHLWDRGH